MFHMSLGLRCVKVWQLNTLELVVSVPSPSRTCFLFLEHGERVYTADVCDHMFHFACILNWLERRANTECPCCRKQVVSEDAVWEAVKASRDGAKAKKNTNKGKNRLDTRRQNDRAAVLGAADKRDDTLLTPAHLGGMGTAMNKGLDGLEPQAAVDAPAHLDGMGTAMNQPLDGSELHAAFDAAVRGFRTGGRVGTAGGDTHRPPSAEDDGCQRPG